MKSVQRCLKLAFSLYWFKNKPDFMNFMKFMRTLTYFALDYHPSKQFSNDFMVSIVSFKSSSTQHDAQLVD